MEISKRRGRGNPFWLTTKNEGCDSHCGIFIKPWEWQPDPDHDESMIRESHGRPATEKGPLQSIRIEKTERCHADCFLYMHRCDSDPVALCPVSVCGSLAGPPTKRRTTTSSNTVIIIIESDWFSNIQLLLFLPWKMCVFHMGRRRQGQHILAGASRLRYCLRKSRAILFHAHCRPRKSRFSTTSLSASMAL